MRLLNKLKFGSKIAVGFGAVIILLLLSNLTSYFAMKSNSGSFTNFNKIATDTVLAGRIQANLLESLMAVENYVQTGDESQRSLFESRQNKMNEFITEFKNATESMERVETINQIKLKADEFESSFNKIIKYRQNRDSLYKLLNEKGPQMEENLALIMEAALSERNTSLSNAAGNAVKHMLSGRLYAAKFLESNDTGNVELAKSELTKMGNWLTEAAKVAGSRKTIELLNTVSGDRGVYFNSFNEIVSIIDNRNREMKVLDGIGKEISAMAENIKLSIIKEQDAYGPTIKKNNDTSIAALIALSALAIVLSILISLGILRVVTIPIRTVTDTFKDIAGGEADLAVRLKVTSNDEIGFMSKYFNSFMEKLQVIMNENKMQSWLKTGQAELAERLQGEQEASQLCANIISFISKYINAQIGAIYLKDENSVYKMVSSYAYTKRKGILNEVRSGEGLVGQAILEKQLILVTNLPEDYVKINSGIGESVPSSVVVSPCIHNGEVKCVLELGAFHEFTDSEMEFIRQIGETVAVSINSAEARAKMQQLLARSLEQSDRLQVQQEELRQNNEELELQTNALKESEARLQAQQEELRQSNEELEEQTRALKESEAYLQAQQEELRVTNEELEQRTRELERQKNEINIVNEGLRTAQAEILEKAQALETASKYKSEFLANVSHELRTPLNSIIVLSQLLAGNGEDSNLNEKQMKFANTICSSGQDLLKLINDILDLSKVEAGKMEINLEQTSVSELVEYMETSFTQIAAKNGLKFSINIEHGTPEYFETDTQRLQQIVNNLLSNAFKFTHEGEVSVSIGWPEGEVIEKLSGDSRGFISIAVKDTGIGIPVEKQAVIFEAFKQSDGTTSRKYGGTGLGLSISREFTRLIGGQIHLRSEEGKGSIFTVLLPLKRLIHDSVNEAAADVEFDVRDKEEDSKDGKDLNLIQFIEDDRLKLSEGDKTLLIIDDDSRYRQILMELARDKNFKCLAAEDGETGVQLALKYKPCGILVDIGLPGISGWKVIEKLKEAQATSEIPVHVVSGMEYKDIDEDKYGKVQYLRKPANLEKLDEIFNGLMIKDFNPLKRVLIIGSNSHDNGEIVEMIGSENVEVEVALSGKEAISSLEDTGFDCIILNGDLKDMKELELISKLGSRQSGEIPVLIYTQEEPSSEEEIKIKRYVENIIIKGPRSTERLMSEVTLFLREVESKAIEQRRNRIRTGREKEESLRDKKLLIVDDDMRNVFALTSLLEEKGIKVIIGRNGREGIEKLMVNPDTDLIIMDVMMPEMDGYTAMREIRKDSKFSQVPIIALTAKAMKEDRNKCIEAGANDYLTKPLDTNKLISLLKVWLYK